MRLRSSVGCDDANHIIAVSDTMLKSGIVWQAATMSTPNRGDRDSAARIVESVPPTQLDSSAIVFGLDARIF
jgi:hypothetical protein